MKTFTLYQAGGWFFIPSGGSHLPVLGRKYSIIPSNTNARVNSEKNAT
jgi:hypothetical protein